jgi:hypothetical protein
MDDDLFGAAVPAFSPLRIQRNSLQSFDFGNTHDGLWPLRATNAGAGTALDTLLFGNYLLRQGEPRSVDILPIFHTGVPNLAPYQLATGKNGNPLAVGKPFINNFLPTFGDMLRLNMAVPATPRNSPEFSSLGLVQAAVLGLTQAPYNTNANLEFIPNMDGFPNGRRLEDDVTRIELQAVGGVVLAAIGLWYDDYTAGGPNPVTADLLGVLTYSTGVEENDVAFSSTFPYVAAPHRGTDNCLGKPYNYTQPAILPPSTTVGLTENSVNAEKYAIKAYPNPFTSSVSFEYNLDTDAQVEIRLFTLSGQLVGTVLPITKQSSGKHTQTLNTSTLSDGVYYARVNIKSQKGKASKLVKVVKS